MDEDNEENTFIDFNPNDFITEIQFLLIISKKLKKFGKKFYIHFFIFFQNFISFSNLFYIYLIKKILILKFLKNQKLIL